MVMYDRSNVLDLNKEYCAELSKVLSAETLSGSDATKEKVIESVTTRSASLVHFLVHGTPGGRADCQWYQKRGGYRGERLWLAQSFLLNLSAFSFDELPLTLVKLSRDMASLYCTR